MVIEIASPSSARLAMTKNLSTYTSISLSCWLVLHRYATIEVVCKTA